MIKTTAVVVDNKAISGDNDDSTIVKSAGAKGGGCGSDYYYKNFYVRNPNEIKIFENNNHGASESRSSELSSIQQRASFGPSESESKENSCQLVSNALYRQPGSSERFRTVATVHFDEHRPVSVSEISGSQNHREAPTTGSKLSSSPSSNFSHLSLSSSSLSSLSSSSSTASTSSSASTSSTAAAAAFIPPSSLYAKKPPNFTNKSVVIVKQRPPSAKMAYVAPLNEPPTQTAEPKLKVVQKPSGYNEIYNNYAGSAETANEGGVEAPSPTTPSQFDRHHQSRQSIVTIKRPGQFARASTEEAKIQSHAEKSEQENQLNELISSGGVKNLRQKFLNNISKANSASSNNLSESDLLKIKSEDESNESGSERDAKPSFVSPRKLNVVSLKNFELKKCKSAILMNDKNANSSEDEANSERPKTSQTTQEDSSAKEASSNASTLEGEIVSIARLAIVGQRVLAHPSHDPMKYGGSCDHLDFETSPAKNLTSTGDSDTTRQEAQLNNNGIEQGSVKTNSLKIKISSRPSISKMQKYRSEMNIHESKKLDFDDYPPRVLKDEKLEVVNFGEILNDERAKREVQGVEQLFDMKKFEQNYNTIKQAFIDLKKDNEFLEDLLSQMTSRVKETSVEVAQMINGPDSLADSFDFDAIENPKQQLQHQNQQQTESISFIKVKSEPANDKNRVSSDFTRIKTETLKAMPPRLPRNSDNKANKPVAVILAMEKRNEQAAADPSIKAKDSSAKETELAKLSSKNSKQATASDRAFTTLIRHKF